MTRFDWVTTVPVRAEGEHSRTSDRAAAVFIFGDHIDDPRAIGSYPPRR